MLLDMELNDGDIIEEDYARRCWSADEVWPERGWVADPTTEGPGIRRPRGNVWRIRQAQAMLNHGVNRQLRLAYSAG